MKHQVSPIKTTTDPFDSRTELWNTISTTFQPQRWSGTQVGHALRREFEMKGDEWSEWILDRDGLNEDKVLILDYNS